jgi:O-antigen ligase
VTGGHALALGTRLPSAGTLVALTLAAALVIAALVPLMRRNPDLVALLAVAVLPFRLPISSAGKTVNLLIPLYVVVAAGTIAHLVPRVLERRGSARSRASQGELAPDGPDAEEPAAGKSAAGARDERPSPAERARNLRESWLSPRGLQWLLLAAVLLYVLQTAYSSDRGKAAENIVFFYIPFGLLFLLLRDVRWRRELLLRCLGIAVALAVVFAGVGFIEYFRKSLFLNPKVVAANQYDNYFRVNSLFFDPNIYGRFLALVMVVLTTAVMWSRTRREVLLGAGVLAWLVCGLITSFSQSSIAALLLGLAVIAAFRWDVQLAVYASCAVVALAAAVLLLAPAGLHFGLKGSGGSTNNATSGRTKLVSGGLELFAKHPLQGYGSGSFETEYKRHSNASAQNATSASHTIPVTVAAEQGLIGLAVYAALLVSAFAVLFRGAGRSPPRIALAACLAALVLHTWTYADFLEDPFTWTVLAIGIALVPQARVRARPELTSTV